MNAKEFVKKFGWSIAIESVDHAVNAYDGLGDSLYCMTDGYASIIHPSYLSGDECLASDLKPLVDAYELVREFGGIQKAKSSWNDFEANHQYEFYGTNLDNLKQAINLVESVGE